MARTPKLRASYNNDAQYMLRLIHAVEKDVGRPQEWREGVIARLNELSLILLQAPPTADADSEGDTERLASNG